MAIVQCKGGSLFGTFLVRIGAGFDPHDQRVVVDRISPVIGKASLYSSLVLVWRALIAPATCKLGAARSGDQPKEPAVSAKGQVAARWGDWLATVPVSPTQCIKRASMLVVSSVANGPAISPWYSLQNSSW